MSDEQQTSSFNPDDKTQVLAKIEAMEAEISRLKTNPRDLPTSIHCNVCGEPVAADQRCRRHPNDKCNHVREGLPGEPSIVLVKQV